MSSNIYDILGLTTNVSDNELKNAYRQYLRENHSDKTIGYDDNARKAREEKVKLLTKAYKCYKDAMEGSTKHHQSSSQEDDDDDDLDDAGQPTEFCQLFSNQEANSAEYREKHTQYILKFFTNPLQLASASIRGNSTSGRQSNNCQQLVPGTSRERCLEVLQAIKRQFYGLISVAEECRRLNSIIRELKVKQQQQNDNVLQQMIKGLEIMLRMLKMRRRLERCINEQCTDSGSDASFHREKAFMLLNWLPAIEFLDFDWVYINTLLQIGISFQMAACLEQKPTVAMADEQMAASIYLTAHAFAKKEPPDFELYVLGIIMKCIPSACQYVPIFSERATAAEAFHKRNSWLQTFFSVALPFNKGIAMSNTALIENKESWMSELQAYLRDKVESVIYVCDDAQWRERVLYQAFEACLRGWYPFDQQDRDETTEEFRQLLMDQMLENRQLSTQDIEFNLNAPCQLDELDNDGWFRSELTSPSGKDEESTGDTFYSSFNGFEISLETGAISFYFVPCPSKADPSEKLFSQFDVLELIRLVPRGAFLSLDQADKNMDYHPFNNVRFKPNRMLGSRLFHTMFDADYMMKEHSVGVEIQRCDCDNFMQRPIEERLNKFSEIASKPIRAFHDTKLDMLSHVLGNGQIHRFWLEDRCVPVGRIVDEENKKIVFLFEHATMCIRTMPMIYDENGELIDSDKYSTKRPCFVLSEWVYENRLKKNDVKMQEKLGNDAFIIVPMDDGRWKLVFWINKWEAPGSSCIVDRTADGESVYIARQLEQLCERKKQQDSSPYEHVKLVDSEMESLVYEAICWASMKTGISHDFSPQQVFAHESTKVYDELAFCAPEFGRIRELVKVLTAINILDGFRRGNLQKIKDAKTLLARNNLTAFILDEMSSSCSTNIDSDEDLSADEDSQGGSTADKLLKRIVRSRLNVFHQVCSGWMQAHQQMKSDIDDCLSQVRRQISVGYLSENEIYEYRKQLEKILPNNISTGAITSFLRHNNKDKLFQEMLDEKETRFFNEIKKQAFPSYPSSEKLKSAFRGSEWDVVCVIDWLVSKELNRLVGHGIILEKGFVELGLGTEAGNDEEEINSDDDANKKTRQFWVPTVTRNFGIASGKKNSSVVYGGVLIKGVPNMLSNSQSQRLISSQPRQQPQQLHRGTGGNGNNQNNSGGGSGGSSGSAGAGGTGGNGSNGGNQNNKPKGPKEMYGCVGRGTGPSGKLKRHFPTYPSRKAAEEAARRAGKGQPEWNPPHGPGQMPHYHSTDKNGKKIEDGVHHQYNDKRGKW